MIETLKSPWGGEDTLRALARWSSALWRRPQICRSPKGENMMVGMPDILNASILTSVPL
jgi:hypothetical protein